MKLFRFPFRMSPLLRQSASILAGFSIVASNSSGLEWRDEGPHRFARLTVPAGSPGFSLMEPGKSGLDFTNQLAETRSLTNQVYLNGSGVAAGDVNADGRVDLYFCGLDNPNELFLNQGNWNFLRGAAAGGSACADQASTGASFADIDGDGDLDLLVNGIARGTRLFLNDGRAQFKEATQQFGLTSKSGAMSLALADIDGDGFLDLYVVNYRNSTFRDEPEKRFRVNNSNGRFELVAVDGRPVSEPDLIGRFTVNPVTGVMENGESDVLYRNRSGKHFEPVSWTGGTFLDKNGRNMQVPFDWGLSAMFHDVNGDGAPDLYVCNDFHSEDRLWINDGHGKFRLVTENAFRHTSLFSMGVDFADLDGDGRDEIFVADMLSREHARRQTQLMDRGPAAMLNATAGLPQFSRNTLFWNRGDGSFAEIGLLSRVAASEWSWSPAFLDVDLDAYPDLIITAGHARDAQNIDVSRAIEREQKTRNTPWRAQLELRRQFPKLEFPLLAFRNNGNNGNLTFDFKQAEWGFTLPQVAQGMALADLDNDGDLDLAVNCLNGPALLYRNNCGANRVAVRLAGKGPNTRAVGARITVIADGLPAQSSEITAGGRYLSGDDTIRAFATGSSSKSVIRVRWRNGKETILEQVLPNHIYEISEEDSAVAPQIPKSITPPIFTDVSAMLNHIHQDQAFDDFQRQPLIPRKFSTLGPGLAWFDLDGDGWEELIIGSGRTGRTAAFQNKSGRLQSLDAEVLSRPGTRDRTTLIGWQHGTNRSVVIGSANYEDGLTNGPAARIFNWNSQAMDDALPGFSCSSGSLAMADADGDGDLDLFLGGRVTAARFPEAASSRFFRNENGKLILDEARSGAFENVGLVSAATWSDLDGNGKPELVLACDGGPIKIFSFKEGAFTELTANFGLTNRIGLWNSIATGDFDNDGRPDMIAGNWGRNTLHEEHRPEGCWTYYAPQENGPSLQIIEAYRDSQSQKIVPGDNLDALTAILPYLPQRYPTFGSFGAASVSEILGENAPRYRVLHVNTFDTMLFLNRGTNFLARPLPVQAQFSPVFGIAVGDLDADGNEDLFLSQNFFGLKQNARYDAGRGLLLLGDGTGEFRPLSAEQSGIVIDGEGRAAAFCDYDHDGKLDLAVAQNSGSTRLFHNKAPKRGLRVLLSGPPNNPAGIGTSVRLQYADGTLGPSHELHAGEGYWSQAGGSVVLGVAKEPKTLLVRSPHGARETIPLAHSQQDVLVRSFPAVSSPTSPDSVP